MDRESFKNILEELIDELPPEFFNQLYGGIVLEDECKYSPYGKNKDLIIAGEYVYHSQMGSQVKIYYGSFEQLYPGMEPEKLRINIRKVLRHEFRHHLERLAGEKDLEVEDAEYIARYLANRDV